MEWNNIIYYCKDGILHTDSCIVVSVLISVTGAINIPRTVEAFSAQSKIGRSLPLPMFAWQRSPMIL